MITDRLSLSINNTSMLVVRFDSVVEERKPEFAYFANEPFYHRVIPYAGMLINTTKKRIKIGQRFIPSILGNHPIVEHTSVLLDSSVPASNAS